MRTLKVGFSRNKDNKIFSVILQKYMNRPYSHCFVEYNTQAHLGDNAIYHSSISAGIGYMSKTIFEEHNIIVGAYEVVMEDKIYDEVRRTLFSVCGREYGVWQNIGVGIVDLCRHLGFKVKNPWVENENCSEMLFRHFISIAYPQFIDSYDPNTITPSDIEKIVSKIGIKISI